jgi:hypothetical protein
MFVLLLATLCLAGVLFGDRAVKYHDIITFQDHKHGLRYKLGKVTSKLIGVVR